MLFFSLVLLSSLYLEKCEANDGIDLNLFHQHDYELKFERLVLTRSNKSLVDFSMVTFKYNRTLAVVNATFTPKIDLGHVDNNMVSITQVYKFLSNEYRYFPLRFAANTCKAINANVAGMEGFKRCGNFTGCPFLKGKKYHVCHWYPDPSQFPPLIPNGEFMIEIQVLQDSQELAVARGYVTISRPIIPV